MSKRYLEKVWYFAGWSDELSESTVKEIVLSEKRIALFRTESGVVNAVGNRCPHRFAPLHFGKVRGETIECGYHGLRFGADGKCAFNPHSKGAIPDVLAVPRYATLERDNAIWVWLAEVDPDTSLVPDLGALVSYPQTSLSHIPTMFVKADHQLIIDNIFDPVHAEFLHLGTFGGKGTLNRPKASIRKLSAGVVEAEWFYEGEMGMPYFNDFLPEAERYDTWLTARWHAPGVIQLGGGVMPSGQPRENGPLTVAFHILMPQEKDVTAYDYRAVRNFSAENAELTAILTSVLQNAFANEDKPIIEAQQRMLDSHEFLELGPALLQSDAAAVQVRRAYDALLETELATVL